MHFQWGNAFDTFQTSKRWGFFRTSEICREMRDIKGNIIIYQFLPSNGSSETIFGLQFERFLWLLLAVGRKSIELQVQKKAGKSEDTLWRPVAWATALAQSERFTVVQWGTKIGRKLRKIANFGILVAVSSFVAAAK